MNDQSSFVSRHIGASLVQQHTMLSEIGVVSPQTPLSHVNEAIEQFLRRAIPSSIFESTNNNVPQGLNSLDFSLPEHEVLEAIKEIAGKNSVFYSMIGQGYYDTITPPVILRNILENPAWYTAYTPYQPEISQGRLEALLNFQTMVSDLTGLPVSGASLLDEGTAAAESVALMYRAQQKTLTSQPILLVDADIYPQTLDVIKTRTKPLGIAIEIVDLESQWLEGKYFGVIAQQIGNSGAIKDISYIINKAHEQGSLVSIGSDLLALTLLIPPGEVGADICYGTTQRFGVPLGFGGPHAGFMSVSHKYARQLPGRIVGISHDQDGDIAYRLALQTREQHIRRDKATSNICTSQVLLAIIAGMYAVYHGPEGLRTIALQIYNLTWTLAYNLRINGIAVIHDHFFDTITVQVPDKSKEIISLARNHRINFRYIDNNHLAIACDERTTPEIISTVLSIFEITTTQLSSPPKPILERTSSYLEHPTFHNHHTETALLRYIRQLSDKDLALDRTMIPLGSCTMKLNATTEMIPITWPEFSRIHPFAPAEQTVGYRKLISDVQQWLADITGYDRVSIQPNAGSQGEYTGLLAIVQYHVSCGQGHRRICLIPSSAHGTNAASAAMAGLEVVVVQCRDNGDVDTSDLKEKIAEYADKLSSIMITYPSTHGIYEHEITEICALVHEAGGQVYIDGANLNALVGLARPGKFGGDVSHLNLHKTFCIPHGGGGPGVGPIAVKEHLAPFLPGHVFADLCAPELSGAGAVSSTPYGSASILPITWAYIKLMGAKGLREATIAAVISANYIAYRLDPYFPILYRDSDGHVAHECILDFRKITKETGVTVEDIAKRLADYSFHAPTMSFPVAGTLMIEPTESENLTEIDQFCSAMISIASEIDQIKDGLWTVENSPLRNAPHTAKSLVKQWDYPYSREQAAYPQGIDSPRSKVWPAVRRIDGAYGDRNLICSCPS